MIKKNPPIIASLVIMAVIVALSFGQAVNFSIWQDDNALFFKLQHLGEQVGVFGAGSFGLGAYRYIAVPYIPLYKLVGINIPIFYIFALICYFLASASIFFLCLRFTNDKTVARIAGVLFAAGFTGSDGILRLFNSIQTSYSIVFVACVFFFLHRFLQNSNKRDYFLSLIFFYLALESAFIRTQYLIVPGIIFFLLFFKWKKFENFKSTIFHFLPFLLIYFLILSRNLDPRSVRVSEYINSVFAGKLEYTHSFFASLGNIIVPQPILKFLFNLAGNISLDYTNRLLVLEILILAISLLLTNLGLKKYRKIIRFFVSLALLFWFIFGMIYFQNSEDIFIHSQAIDMLGVLANFIGGLFLISVLILMFVFPLRRNTAKIILFLLSWLLANILAYSTYLPFTPLDSINRYLTHSLAPYAILISILVWSAGKKVGLIIVIPIILTNILLSIGYQHDFITKISVPTNKFYEDLRRFAPEIKKGSVLYFDVAENEQSQQEFRDFFSVGSMPDQTAIAIRYGIDRYDLTMTTEFDEFITLLKDKPLDSSFSFFYSRGVLKDTSLETKSSLSDLPKVKKMTVGDISLVTPALLEFKAKVIPKFEVAGGCRDNVTYEERRLLYEYFSSRANYLSQARVYTTSQEKYQTAKSLIDGKAETLWRGGRGWWQDNKREEVIIDLGKNQQVGELVWTNGYANSTPTSYSIEVSVDKREWNTVKKVREGGKKANGEMVVDDFNPILAHFVKLIIENTYDNDSPAVGEIEVVEEPFVNLDKSNLSKLEATAFCMTSIDSINLLRSYLEKSGLEAVISWKTDKSSDNVTKTNLIFDNVYHTYQVFLPAGGTSVSDLKIDPGVVPVKIDIIDIQSRNLSLGELVKREN